MQAEVAPELVATTADGFIHPGQLALYRPSVPLSDYRFEFMAQIENKSVDWVVRAKDADNYYALGDCRSSSRDRARSWPWSAIP